jgi:hypothetical protein
MRTDEPQHALHVTDYRCALALAELRAMGACSRKMRKLSDDEFDYDQESIQNGEGPIY